MVLDPKPPYQTSTFSTPEGRLKGGLPIQHEKETFMGQQISKNHISAAIGRIDTPFFVEVSWAFLVVIYATAELVECRSCSTFCIQKLRKTSIFPKTPIFKKSYLKNGSDDPMFLCLLFAYHDQYLRCGFEPCRKKLRFERNSILFEKYPYIFN